MASAPLGRGLPSPASGAGRRPGQVDVKQRAEPDVEGVHEAPGVAARVADVEGVVDRVEPRPKRPEQAAPGPGTPGAGRRPERRFRRRARRHPRRRRSGRFGPRSGRSRRRRCLARPGPGRPRRPGRRRARSSAVRIARSLINYRPPLGPQATATAKSGRLDLNQRPHRPERCALPGCATPRGDSFCQEPGSAADGRHGGVDVLGRRGVLKHLRAARAADHHRGAVDPQAKSAASIASASTRSATSARVAGLLPGIEVEVRDRVADRPRGTRRRRCARVPRPGCGRTGRCTATRGPARPLPPRRTRLASFRPRRARGGGTRASLRECAHTARSAGSPSAARSRRSSSTGGH